jgi:glycosyltransferase involved in cell wall biosynthesis
MSTLVVLSHMRWDFVFQRPQHLLTRLARRHRVVYVEQPVQDPGAARLARLQPCANLTVLRPHTPLAEPGFSDEQLHVLQPLLKHYVEDESIDAPLAWVCTPLALPLLPVLRPRAVIYDCIDALAACSNEMRECEAQLLRTADLVLTGGPSLFQAKRALNHNVHCMPSSVDAAHFAPERITANCEEYLAAERLQSHILAPRLGFFGVIDERVDLDLIAALADARPDWHLVMVGPVVGIAHEPPRRPNIHWLGHQPYSRLPALVAAWDACLLPYAVNEHTRFVSPTKTLEYLAAEKPVVSTAVNDVISMYGDVVRIARGQAAFVAACAAVLAETPHHRAERLVQSAACVSRFSWDESAQTVQRLIEQTLERKDAQRVAANDEALQAPVKPSPAGAFFRPPATSSSAGTW